MKKILNILCLFCFSLVWNGLYHLVILADLNASIREIHRTDLSNPLLWSLVMTAGIAAIFTIWFSQFPNRISLAGALKFGFQFSLLTGLLVDFNQYLQYPISGRLTFLWFTGGLFEFSVYGCFSYLVLKNESSENG